ncbi:MAG: EthD domain-containing protein [Proteobacteria bacterium]|nr:EthD domain-containing protein [Pseudomonadota bacterium]
MEKLVYLIGTDGDPAELGRDLQTVLGEIDARVGLQEIELLVADIPQTDVPRMHRNDPERRLSALVSVWVDSLDARGPLESELSARAPRLAGYLVTESMPREYRERGWPADAPSPGLALVTALNKRAGLSDEEFYTGWHGGHTPLSLRLHPLTRYVRNAVARALTPDAPDFGGIVWESVATYEDADDPLRFYGSEEGQRETESDLRSWASFSSMLTTQMHEYLLKPGAWRPFVRSGEAPAGGA